MNYLSRHPLVRTLAISLTLGVLIVGIFSMATMNHVIPNTGEGNPVFISAENCSQPQGSGTCLDYHLGVMQSLSNALPGSAGLSLLGLMFLTLFTFSAFGLLGSAYLYYCRIKTRFKQLYEETVEAFQNQLGFWLAIIQKKDPSYAFAIM